jgi:hypothetical protein
MYGFRGEADVLQQARYNPSESESKRNDFAEGAYISAPSECVLNG